MARKLVVSIKNMTDENWQHIERAARDNGWTAEFYGKVEEAIEASRDAEVVFADTPDFVGHAPDLKWMISPSAGVNHFTRSDAFMKSGVMLSNSSGAYGVTISEHIVMATLTMLRRIPEYEAHIAAKNWFKSYFIKSIKGARVTFLGTGDIGCETARKFKGFGPEKMTGVNTSGKVPADGEEGLFDEIVKADDLASVLPVTDILIMSLPFTPKTYRIMDEAALGKLPEGALIVNVGRGVCIDEEALIKMLKAGRLRAALDVFEKEPIPEDSELWDCPNLLITPHIAGDMFLKYTVDRIVELFVEDFLRYVKGEKPERLVDLTKGY